MNFSNHSNFERSTASPWALLAFLLILTVSNFLIGYASFGITAKIWIFAAGVLTPMLLWFLRAQNARDGREPFVRQEFLREIPSWIWVLAVCAALAFRFWKVGSFGLWPTGDEALHGEAGIALSQKWSWRFFYTAGENPPTLFWICGLFFKLFRSAFFNLWMPSALISCLTLGAGYWAARQFFSKSFSFLCSLLLAFSYWPLFLGRICVEGVTVPLFGLCALFCLGKTLKAQPDRRTGWAFLLGVCTGLNSFAFTAWPALVLAVCIAVVAGSRNVHRPRARMPAVFTAGLFAGLIPFIAAALQSGFGRHIQDVAFWSGAWDTRQSILVIANYLSVLGWGALNHDRFCTPVHGGFLNPLLASFFCLGLLRLYQHRSLGLVRWLAAAFLLFLLPGFLTFNMDSFRIVQVLPLLLVVTAWGIEPVLKQPWGSKAVWLAVILLFTAVFDFSRLAWPTLDPVRHPEGLLAAGKSLERYRAYQELEKIKNQAGPGIVLGEWDPSADRTLDVTTYFWNAARYPALLPEKAAWLGVVMDASYRPFLEPRFPKAQWKGLDSDASKEKPLVLCLLMRDDSNQQALLQWAQADEAFRSVNRATDHVNDKDCLEIFDRDMKRNYPLIKGDAFLESCFWEKVGAFYYYYGGHYPEHLLSVQRALERGYPAAHLYYQLAGLYHAAGKEKEAGEALAKAAKRADGGAPARGEGLKAQ